MADGASDAWASRRWAKALVDAYLQLPINAEDTDALLKWLEGPIDTWQRGISWSDLSYHQQEKARMGSFATFLGICFDVPNMVEPGAAAESFRWQALAVGDTCLFITGPAGQTQAHFPMNHAAEFGTTPALLSTNHDYNIRSLNELTTCCGELRPTEWLVLATDALSAWLLSYIEQEREPWHHFADMTQATFTEFIYKLRSENSIRNDDVTLAICRLDKE